MRKRDWLSIFFIILFYFIVIFLSKREIFSFKFDKSLIKKYFLSQDIPHEVAGKRLFLSDGEIYLATGYLYLQGYDPSEFNFEHPPLTKYLFGLSIKFFNNPYFIQIGFGMMILILVYYLGIKIFKKSVASFITCLFLILDPLFVDLSSQPLLDFSQTVFFILYFLSVFYWKNYILQGIFLALFAGTKFWVSPIFFIFIFAVFQLYKKEFKFKEFIYHLLVAFFVYCLLYTQTFIIRKGNFNIIWHILKTFKYRLIHNSSSFPGASLVMFLTGYFRAWWGKKEILRANIWSPFWLISFLVCIRASLVCLIQRKIGEKFLISVVPVLYLFYLGVQAPFPRYFMIILPFSYLVLSEFIYSKFKQAT